MSDIIRLLPDSIANQIAAGEVVQRPASVAKELLENAVDAGATAITLIVQEAGKGLVQVMDDGKGMSETDVRMSLERHATSKIEKAEDLFSLRTMGFRGEALASIAAVSQMEIKTRQEDQELGTLLRVEASTVKVQEPTACDKGCSIAVKNLFYNIPARRNFLKSNARELELITNEFIRIALSHAEIAFRMVNEGETEYDVQPAKLSQRVVALLGSRYIGQLAPCQEETTWLRVKGYIGKPESARKKRGAQFLFANNRFIKSPTLNYAVTQAYEGLLPEKSYPLYILFIDIDPQHIDVNVHPTKTEVKFDDERSVYSIVWSAVKQALGANNLAPSIDFSSDVNLLDKVSKANVSEVYTREQFPGSGREADNQAHWEKLFEPSAGGATQATMLKTVESDANRSEAPGAQEGTAYFQWQKRYIVTAMRDNLLVIDQQLAHERILYEQFAQQQNTGGASQQLLFPQTITLPVADFKLVMEMQEELDQLGFRLEEFGKNALLVTGVPVEAATSEKELLEDLLEQFKHNRSELKIPVQDNLARCLAKRLAIRAGLALSGPEMESIIGGLFASEASRFTPEGHPIFFILDSTRIQSYFAR